MTLQGVADGLGIKPQAKLLSGYFFHPPAHQFRRQLGQRGICSAPTIRFSSPLYTPIFKPIDLPTDVSVFPKDINRAPRKWAERVLSNIAHWREVEHGGHFAAFEQPDIFVREVRECFRSVR